MSSQELEEIRSEIPFSDSLHKDYWNSLLVLVDNQLDIISGQIEGNPSSHSHLLTPVDDGAIHSTVLPDVDCLLAEKSTEELLRLELEIQSSVKQGRVIDEEYWQSVLKRLRICKASVKSAEVHRDMVAKRLLRLSREGVLSRLLFCPD